MTKESDASFGYEEIKNIKNFRFGWKTVRNNESMKKNVEFGPISRGDVGQTFQWESGHGTCVLHDYLNKGIWLTIDNKIYDASTEECSMAVSDIFYDDGFDDEIYEGIEDVSDPMHEGVSPTIEETIEFLNKKGVLSASYINCDKETFLTLYTGDSQNIYSSKYIRDIEKIAKTMLKMYSNSNSKYKLERELDRLTIKKDTLEKKGASTLSVIESIEVVKKKLSKYKINYIEYIKSTEGLSDNKDSELFL